MISPPYVRGMAAYNAEMNRRVYAAAGRLSDAERRAERGAFWGSIHGTLSHLVWGDMNWMSRLAGRPKPAAVLKESAGMFADFGTMQESRFALDADISQWAKTVTDEWLAGTLIWFSGATQREQTAPRALILVHMFNHQTHHRGQAHAMVTAAGQDIGDTDLPFILPPSVFAG